MSLWPSLTVVAVLACAGCDGAQPAAPDASTSDARGRDPSTPDAFVVDPPPAPTTIAGPLTITTWGDRPFLSPASIDEVLDTRFSIGREFFVAAWVVAPNATRPNIDGLGPLLHAPSCVACHPIDRRAPSLEPDGTVGVGLLFRLATPGPAGLAPDPVLGVQLQPSGIPGVPAEAIISHTAGALPPYGGSAASAKPVFTFAIDPAYGAMAADTRAGARLSPQLLGMGLLEAVADDAILALEDPDDIDGDGVSGRAARLAGGAIGRFGWKAVHPALAPQTLAAFANDIGIASADVPDDCTPSQHACRAAAHGGDPELASADATAVDTFMRLLGVPAARRTVGDPHVERGHEVFVTAGCASCHQPTLTTRATARPAILASVTFYPYTDLLLHDLGPALADELGEGDASASEWRTPPLWGIGLVESQPGGRFLHDGRAASIADAIRWHGGEAQLSAEAFAALSIADEDALLTFLRSL